jgi:hypothetical protein
MCVFLGLVMLPEFKELTPAQQQLAKWVVLFHDVEKIHIRGQRDYTHGFRSAITAAGTLPKLGFPVTAEFENNFTAWGSFTNSAVIMDQKINEEIQDNKKLPAILSGIEQMFGKDSPAALIVKGVLFHMSLNVVVEWPQTAPLTDAEIKVYITSDLAALLKVMNLADNEGWVMFYPEARAIQRYDTLAAYQRFEKLINPTEAH